MKKLLLVLLAVAIASFLFVGCLPVTPSEGEGEGEGEVEAEVTIEVENEYKSPAEVTYVPCVGDVTITFPNPVDIDYVVYVARKFVDEDGNVEYKDVPSIETEPAAATPNADRTVWTLEDYPLCTGEAKKISLCECEPICLVALVKHPCCPGEEVALRVVTVDCYPPVRDLFVKFTDCHDDCIPDDPCNPQFEGVSMEWTSRTTGDCVTTDCCIDECSGIKGWSVVVRPDPCEGPCDSVSGTSCPVEGVIECGCLPYADTDEDCYYIDFYLDDNVGNAVESTWKICLDTDEVTSVEVDYDPDGLFSCDYTAIQDSGGWWQIYGNCTPFPIPG